MIVFREPGEVPAHFGPSVVVIGKFDGVHSGHRAVIDRARVTATDAYARVVAVTFDRNPLSLLRPELCPDPLSSVESATAAVALVAENWQPVTAPIRLLTVTVSGLTDSPAAQTSLFEAQAGGSRRSAELDRAVDALREKFGGDAVSYGRLLGNKK